MKFKDKVWRHIPAGAHPPHVGYIIKARGRWNRAGEYGCIYTSLTEGGAKAEYRKYLSTAGIHELGLLKPHEVVSLIVKISLVMDLTDRKSFPVSPKESFLVGDKPEAGRLSRTRGIFFRLFIQNSGLG